MEVTFYLKEKANIWWYQVYSDNLKWCTDIKKCWCDISDEEVSFYIGKIKKSSSKKAIYSWVLTYKKGLSTLWFRRICIKQKGEQVINLWIKFCFLWREKASAVSLQFASHYISGFFSSTPDLWFIFLISPIMFVYLFLISRSGKQYEWSWLNMSGVLKKKSRGKRLVGKMDVNNNKKKNNNRRK